MKLLRFTDAGTVRLGVLDGGTIVALDALASDYPTMLSIVAGGNEALEKVRSVLAARSITVPLAGASLLAPIEQPGKYMAIGMNFQKHVKESEELGVEAPKKQFWFNKQTTCLSGPYDDIDPGVTEMLDYEVELAVVVGAPAKRVDEADARDHVFGYTVANDVSARDWQFHSPTFTMGKSFDTHGPIGPWITTDDEIADPHDLMMTLELNGEERQRSSTNDMIYNIYDQIAYLSQVMTLEPGDLIATGTPSGVGIAGNRFMKAGDVVRVTIDGLGSIENRFVNER